MTWGLAARTLEHLVGRLGGVNRVVWRVGHKSAPLDFVPHAYCSWQHRFDDPRREYRTLYCAEDPATCLREVLGDLRPNTKVRVEFEQFQLDQGIPPYKPAAEVTAAWRQQNTLAPALVIRNGPLADLENRMLLEQLADKHAGLLAAHGMPQLDLTQITSKTRPVTQTISRDLFDHDAVGVKFRSNHDGRRCIVLFEGRAKLQRAGRQVSMVEDHPALVRVCGEYGLILRGSWLSNTTTWGTWRP